VINSQLIIISSYQVITIIIIAILHTKFSVVETIFLAFTGKGAKVMKFSLQWKFLNVFANNQLLY